MNTDIAQLVSVALYTPKPAESLAFFHDLLGMEISHREGQSVYLRAYEDFYQYTLKLTEAKEAGLEEVTWRASSPEALGNVVKRIEASGLGDSWTDQDYAQSTIEASTARCAGAPHRSRQPDGE